MEFEESPRDTNFSGCTSLVSEDRQNVVFYIKVAFSVVGISMNSIAIVLLLAFKSYYLLIFRIVMYIMIANLFQVITQLLEMLPVVNEDGYNRVKDGWTTACRSFGFLDQVTAWMGHLCMLWLVLYFLYLILNHKRLERAVLSRRELVGIAMCFFFPFVFNWIPFTNDYYGFSGSWCWIKLTKKVCNDTDIGTGFSYILGMYYVPLLFFVLINSFVCTSIFVILCRRRSSVKQVIFVLIYPLVYGVLFIVVTISRIESSLRIRDDRRQSYPLWIAHSVGDPARIIIPSFLVILQIPFTRKVIKNLRLNQSINNTVNDKNNEKKHLIEVDSA